MLYEFFLIGGIFWWGLVLAATIAIIVNLEYESLGGAITVAVLSLLVMQVLGDLNIQAWERPNYFTLLYCVLAYVAIGVVWGVIRWAIFSFQKKREYNEIKRKWLEKEQQYNPELIIPTHLKKKFADHLTTNTKLWEYRMIRRPGDTRDTETRVPLVAPRASRHKEQIATWMAFWPWSFLWTVLRDGVMLLFRHLQWLTGWLMDAISRFWFRGVEEDFAE